MSAETSDTPAESEPYSLTLPEPIMQMRSKLNGARLFGRPVEQLSREALLAALSWALASRAEARAEAQRNARTLMRIQALAR